MTTLYLDTEWADPEGRQLVSLALVGSEGHELYAERAELPTAATAFVQSRVYPALDRGRMAVGDLAFATALRRFISVHDAPEIVYDLPNDLMLMIAALNGFERVKRRALDAAAFLSRYRLRLFQDPLASVLLEDPVDAFFAAHPEGLRHHALWDARALRYAASSRPDPWLPRRSCSPLSLDGRGRSSAIAPPAHDRVRIRLCLHAAAGPPIPL